MKKRIDWDKLKREYLDAERMTLSELAAKHEVNYQSLRRQSAKEGWSKEKRAKAERLKAEIKKEQKKGIRRSAKRNKEQLDKIGEIANKLIEKIGEGADYAQKPNSIAFYAGALKDLTAILRDVNNIPTQKEERTYKLAKEKLKLEKQKVQSGDKGSEEGGVIELPVAKTNE